MSKYCSEDLRNAAEDVENYSGYDEDIIADMLRFAADVLEREEKCERKFEYTVKYEDGEVSSLHYCFVDPLKHGKRENHRIIRRSVGEWEDYKDA